MQTFLPYPDFTKSAKCLDDKRLGKQRVEVFQILNAMDSTDSQKGGWRNHPATNMWRGYKDALVVYGIIACREWAKRPNKSGKKRIDTCANKIVKHSSLVRYSLYLKVPIRYKRPHWLGGRIHTTHRSNLLRKDPAFYGRYGWEEDDKLEYYWPKDRGINNVYY